VKPKSTAEFVVREESPIDSSLSVASITPEQISVWIRDRSIDPEIEKALQDIVAKKNEISGLARELASLEKEQKDIFEDQDRIRSNIQRLSRTPEENALRQRYLDKLNDQETRLAAIQDEQDTLEDSRTTAQAQLDEMIQNMSIDKNLN
jgi:chromosome segregation ATPase